MIGGLVDDDLGHVLPSTRRPASGLDVGATAATAAAGPCRPGDEAVVLRDEVGLAGELDHARRRRLRPGGDEALAGGTVGALGIALRGP